MARMRTGKQNKLTHEEKEIRRKENEAERIKFEEK